MSAPSLAYVAAVMVLMAFATTDPNHPKQGLFVIALALCLPALLPALPALFVVVAAVWRLTNADAGGVTWPVTVAYVVVSGAVAVGNVWLIRRFGRTRRHA